MGGYLVKRKKPGIATLLSRSIQAIVEAAGKNSVGLHFCSFQRNNCMLGGRRWSQPCITVCTCMVHISLFLIL